MADLTFSQPARRNLAVPVLLAVAVLIVAVVVVLRFTPHTTADVEVTRTQVYPSHLVFKSDSIVLNSDQTQDDLYVVVTLRIANHLRLPLFLKDFTVSLTPGSTDEPTPPTTSAIEKPDLANVLSTFPALKRLADAQGAPPLFRESKIEPGATAEGYVVLHFPGKEALWTGRKSATIAVDLYHQAPLSVEIPKSATAR